MSDIRIEMIGSRERWEAIALQWNELLNASISDTIFLTYEWLSTWAEVYLRDSRLLILAIYEKNKLIGVAPCYVRKIKHGAATLNAIFSLGTPEGSGDYFDVFMMRGYEKIVSNSIYDFLMTQDQAQWDLIALYDYRCNSHFVMHFSDRIKKEGKYVEVTQGHYCPVNILAENKEKFFAGLSAKRRANYRRELRLLETRGELKHNSYTKENIKNGMDAFTKLYLESEHQNDCKYILFLQKLAMVLSRKDWIQIDILSSNGQAIAGAFHPKYNYNVYGFSIIADKNFNTKVSIGNVLIGLCMEKAVEEGKRVFDMLKGTEDYKFSWTNDVNSSFNLLYYAKTIKCIPGLLLQYAKSAGKIILR